MSGSHTPLRALAQAYGVQGEFHALDGTRHETSPETMRALLAAQGIDATSDRSIDAALKSQAAQQAAQLLRDEHVLPARQVARLDVAAPCEWVLVDENGGQVAEGRGDTVIALPELAAGYYLLTVTAGKRRQQVRLLVRPDKAPDLAARIGRAQGWGLTGALYGLRSGQNGGLGNYVDLAQSCAAFGTVRADFFGINPIHALGWAAGEMISPYSPSDRAFFNSDHIAPERGLGPTPPDDLIDYPAFRARHRVAMEQEYRAVTRPDQQGAFERWQADQGESLHAFSCFEALSEKYGRDFRTWPARYRAPGKAAAGFAPDRARFHAWLQWRAQDQIGRAQQVALDNGMALGLYLDLAVGARPGGSEAWRNGSTIARGVTIGAPPDHLSPAGQSWVLAAHAPGALSAAFYAPLREMLRKLMAHCGLLRIDHALGLLRSFWLPDDGSPGGYVAQPLDALLAVITIEADRAGCVIVGEDLGLVPEGFRETLNASGLYSYAVWQYEMTPEGGMKPAKDLGAQALACFGTHDTPTVQGFWYGCDIELWKSVGWLNTEHALARHSQRARQRQSLRALCAIEPLASSAEIGKAIHRELACAPAALMAMQLDDVFALTEAQNLPGTVDEYPNWRRRLPVAVEDFARCGDIQMVSGLIPSTRKAAPETARLPEPHRGKNACS